LPVALELVRRANSVSRIDEDADGDRYFLFVNEVVEDNGYMVAAVGAHVATAILKNHHASGPGGIVLRGHINPPVTHGVGENLTVVVRELDYRAPRRVFLQHRVGAESVVVRGAKQDAM